MVSDNGTEFSSIAIQRWQQETGIAWHYIAPGKPMQNGFVENLNELTPNEFAMRSTSDHNQNGLQL